MEEKGSNLEWKRKEVIEYGRERKGCVWKGKEAIEYGRERKR